MPFDIHALFKEKGYLEEQIAYFKDFKVEEVLYFRKKNSAIFKIKNNCILPHSLYTDLLNYFKEHILEEEYGISMEMKIRKELEAMCNLSEAIEERGVERGSFIAFSSLVRDGLLRTDKRPDA